jgi:hypothetical protein
VAASDLTVTDSTISGNGATSDGGGIRASGELVINGTTTVTGNNAPMGGGINYSSGTGFVQISGDVTVSSNTAASSVGGGLSVQAQGGMTTTISGATFEENSAQGGGAVFFDAVGDESISFSDVTVQNNDAESNGGGLLVQDDASISGSALTGNTARETVDDGVAEGSGGGGVWAAEDLLVLETSIDGNEASSADPNDSVQGGGILNGFGEATVRRSTISSNELAGGSSRGGAGIAASGSSTTRIENSTLFGNVANGAGSQGGALFQSPATTTMVLAHSTLAGNSAVSSPAIHNNGALILGGSILAGGVAGCGGSGTTTANAYNVDFGTTCVGAANDTDLESTNPQLGALAANGGPTLTMLPIPASPVVDAVPAAACRDPLGAPLAIDQRGLSRPDDGNANGLYDCEAGAVELQVSGPKPADPAIQPPGTAKKCKKAKKKRKKRASGSAKKRKKKKCGKKKKRKRDA